MIQSVDRSAQILRALAHGPRRMGVSELSKQLNLAKGTVHGLLRTLQAHGLVEKDPESDKYQLGPALLEFSNSYLDLNELRSRAFAWSEWLATASGEAVRVGAPHDSRVLIVHHVFRPDLSLQVREVGAVLPSHATALGKAILAYLPPDRIAEFEHLELARLTACTISSWTALADELELVRNRGYATEHEEAVLGEGGIASPIFSRLGGVVGAIGIAGPLERLGDRAREQGFAELVMESARNVSRDFGAV